MHAQLLSGIRLFATPRTVACQAPLSMEFSRQEYWSGLLFLTPGESSQSRDQNPVSYISALVSDSLPLATLGKPLTSPTRDQTQVLGTGLPGNSLPPRPGPALCPGRAKSLEQRSEWGLPHTQKLSFQHDFPSKLIGTHRDPRETEQGPHTSLQPWNSFSKC